MNIFKRVFIFLLIIISFNGFGSRYSELVSVINQELNELVRLSKQKSHSDPYILLRIAELHLEKARLIKNRENQRYISIPPKQRKAKKYYFKESNKHFSYAQKTSIRLLKRFKNFPEKGEVFYILAFNAKEFKQFKRSRKYFYLAVKNSKRNSELHYKSKKALAELLFNEKKYKEAARVYEDVINIKVDKWFTKDAYNLAWSHYHSRKYNKAISVMEKVLDLSKDPDFVDNSSAASRDLPLFYLSAGKINKAKSYYESQGQDPAKKMFYIAQGFIRDGKVKQAKGVLASALDLADNNEQRIKISLDLLDMYEKFAYIPEHLAVSKKILKIHKTDPLAGEDLERYTYHVKHMAAKLQKQVVDNKLNLVRQTRKKKAKLANQYFQLLANLSKGESHLSIFHSGETDYAVGRYSKALKKYNLSYDRASMAGDNKIMKLSLEGALAALAQPGISPETKKKFLIPTFEKYLAADGKSKRAKKIYPKLFNNYFDKKDMAKAEGVMLRYAREFPNDSKTHEGMAAKLIGRYQKAKKANDIKRIYGYFGNPVVVSPKYKNNIRLLLLTYKFDQVEVLTTKGQKTDALKGYLAIYKNPSSSPEAKRNAAYNIAVLYYELGRLKGMYSWSSKAVDLMTVKEVNKFESDLMRITRELYQRRQFNSSAILSEKLFTKLCTTNSKKKSLLFSNIVALNLAEGNEGKALNTINKAAKCRIKKKAATDAKVEVLDSLILKKDYYGARDLIENLERNPSNQIILIKPMAELRKLYLEEGRDDIARDYRRKILSYYDGNQKQKSKMNLETLNAVADLKLEDLKALGLQTKNVKLSFPEKKFNLLLKSKLSKLDAFTEAAVKVQRIGSGDGIVLAYKYLVEIYASVVKEIRSFKPKGKSEAYIKSFSASMERLTKPVLAKTKQFKREAKGQILKNKILSVHNKHFLVSVIKGIQLEYQYYLSGVLMDKGGKR